MCANENLGTRGVVTPYHPVVLYGKRIPIGRRPHCQHDELVLIAIPTDWLTKI